VERTRSREVPFAKLSCQALEIAVPRLAFGEEGLPLPQLGARARRERSQAVCYKALAATALNCAIGLRPGDALIITRLDRLARSTSDLLNVLAAVTVRGAGFRSLNDAWTDTTMPHGQLMLTILGGLAQLRRKSVQAGQRGGLRPASGRRPLRLAHRHTAGLESPHRTRANNMRQNAVGSGCRRIRIGTRLSCRATVNARISWRFAIHLRITNEVRQGAVTGPNEGEEYHALQGRDECDGGRCRVGHRECGCLRA
jgi:hypothetical protein